MDKEKYKINLKTRLMLVCGKFWKIECTQHLTPIFTAKIKVKDISEKYLVDFIRIIIAKYAFSDDEILEQHLRIPFQKKKDYINVKRTNGTIDNELWINFSAQSSDISIVAYLSD